MTDTSSARLSGKRVLVTRSREQADSLIALLRGSGAEVIHHPAIEFRAPPDWASVDEVIERMPLFEWLVFTSTNGVDWFLGRFRQRGRRWAELGTVRVAAVGEKTAIQLRAAGLEPAAVPDQYQSSELTSLLSGSKSPVALIRAREGREELIQSLESEGISVHIAVAYETAIIDSLPDDARNELREGRIDALSFTSPSTVKGILGHLDRSELDSLKGHAAFVSIGPTTTKALNEFGISEVVEAERATVESLCQAIVNHFANGT